MSIRSFILRWLCLELILSAKEKDFSNSFTDEFISNKNKEHIDILDYQLLITWRFWFIRIDYEHNIPSIFDQRNQFIFVLLLNNEWRWIGGKNNIPDYDRKESISKKWSWIWVEVDYLHVEKLLIWDLEVEKDFIRENERSEGNPWQYTKTS